MTIVFNINKIGLEGLGATLNSLIIHCPQTEDLSLVFLCSSVDAIHKRNIQHLLKDGGYCGKIKYIDYNAQEIFKNLPGLHGDLTIYGRLLIPKYIDDDYVLLMYSNNDIFFFINKSHFKVRTSYKIAIRLIAYDNSTYFYLFDSYLWICLNI